MGGTAIDSMRCVDEKKVSQGLSLLNKSLLQDTVIGLEDLRLSIFPTLRPFLSLPLRLHVDFFLYTLSPIAHFFPLSYSVS